MVQSDSKPVIVWFRHDLRLADHPALSAAVAVGQPVILLHVMSNRQHQHAPGAASRWWLHHSLRDLTDSLKEFGQQLTIRSGDPVQEILRLVEETGASHVYWNQRYEPHEREQEQELKELYQLHGVAAVACAADLLVEPDLVLTKSSQPYQVFTPFWKNYRQRDSFPAPLVRPEAIQAPKNFPETMLIDELALLPEHSWADGFNDAWNPGEEAAQQLLDSFIDNNLSSYRDHRNLPAFRGTSRLSPYLHFGEMTSRQIAHRIQNVIRDWEDEEQVEQAENYLTEIGWREFAHYIMYHFPETMEQSMRREFDRVVWSEDLEWLRAWKQGQTGFPIVDAGMRQLWQTGWMHNRVRMIVASFLTKHLQINWREGERWFWDTLVDADQASNTMGWQWTAGCGADAAPYFRIFNPVLQAEKFDPQGEYIRRWCPELKDLPTQFIHNPASASAEVLKEAGVTLGENYPHPIVDLKQRREVALQKWDRIKALR